MAALWNIVIQEQYIAVAVEGALGCCCTPTHHEHFNEFNLTVCSLGLHNLPVPQAQFDIFGICHLDDFGPMKLDGMRTMGIANLGTAKQTLKKSYSRNILPV